MHKQEIRFCNYNQIKIGPYLRFEKVKRQYGGYFKFQQSLLNDLVIRYRCRKLDLGGRLIKNPSLSFDDLPNDILFNSIPHWDNYFEGLNQYRLEVKSCLFQELKTEILDNYYQVDEPEIGVHIRMGDFRKLRPGEDFAKVGSVRTPEEYFIDIIQRLRILNKTECPVTVFTDGYQAELNRLFALPNIKIPEPNTDIGDLLHLSKSKIIVTSAGSTFSYWAGFLSEAAIIMHPNHIHQRLRLETGLFEGSIDMFETNKINR